MFLFELHYPGSQAVTCSHYIRNQCFKSMFLVFGTTGYQQTSGLPWSTGYVLFKHANMTSKAGSNRSQLILFWTRLSRRSATTGWVPGCTGRAGRSFHTFGRLESTTGGVENPRPEIEALKAGRRRRIQMFYTCPSQESVSACDVQPYICCTLLYVDINWW